MSSPSAKGQSQQPLREAMSILMGLGKRENGGADDAAGMITLAGTNKGAMMKMDEPGAASDLAMHHSGSEGVGAYANSNYQSINNSIVVGGSCSADDPGVHIIIQDYVEEEAEGDHKKKIVGEGKKKKKGHSEDGEHDSKSINDTKE